MNVYFFKMVKRMTLWCLVLIGVQLVELSLADIPKTNGMGYMVYFTIQNSSRELLYTIVVLLALPFLTLMDYFQSMNNQHSQFVIQRIGLKRFYLKALKENFFISFFARALVEIISLFCIHFFYSNINFNEHLTHYLLVNANPLTNIVIYVYLASIGTGIFSCFWFSTIHFIKNKYIFQGVMVFWQFISMILSSLLISLVKERSQMMFAIFTGITPTSLLSPGQIYESECILNFTVGASIYILMTVMLLYVSYKQRLRYA